MVVPCFGCADRTEDCHAKCERYKDFVTTHNGEKAKLEENREKDRESRRPRKWTNRQKKEWSEKRRR